MINKLVKCKMISYSVRNSLYFFVDDAVLNTSTLLSITCSIDTIRNTWDPLSSILSSLLELVPSILVQDQGSTQIRTVSPCFITVARWLTSTGCWDFFTKLLSFFLSHTFLQIPSGTPHLSHPLSLLTFKQLAHLTTRDSLCTPPHLPS